VAQHGQFVGSFHHTEGAAEEDLMRFRYDVGARETTPGGVDVNLRMSLQFQNRPGETDSDLLRSRFFGDLRRSALRLHGQLVPWQSSAAGASPPREHNVQVGADFTPARAPRVSLNFSRRDRDRGDGRAQSDDRRAAVSYALGGLGAEVAFRRIDSRPSGEDPVATRTNEWRGELRGGASRGGLSLQGAYDALLSDFRQRERRREFASHGVNLGAAWNPAVRFTLNGSALGRWGRTDDNAMPDRTLDERYVTGSAQYRPVNGVDLTLLSESRRRREASGDLSADYMQLQGNLRRPIRGAFALQTGFARTMTIASSPGEVPSTSAYAFVDGRLRRGLDARAEVRGARQKGAPSGGTQWHRLVQVRTRPRPATRIDVTWSIETLPIATIERRASDPADTSGAQVDTLSVIPGVTQEDRQWEVTGGYDVRRSLSLVASHRLLDGEGRIDRSERLTSMTASWRASRRMTIAWNASWRRSRSRFEAAAEGGGASPRVDAETTEIVRGIDLSSRLPGKFRVVASWRSASVSEREGSVTYSATLDKSF
jgi:hypothetical protein